MSRPITLHFYEDPGHGWLRAPVTLLEKLQIVDQISRYSYLKGSYAYLEEDCDAGKLMEALKLSPDFKLDKVVRHYCQNESAIRSYYPFTASWRERLAKVPVEGMRLVYGRSLMTLVKPTKGGWYAEIDGGAVCYMSHRAILEATVLGASQ